MKWKVGYMMKKLSFLMVYSILVVSLINPLSASSINTKEATKITPATTYSKVIKLGGSTEQAENVKTKMEKGLLLDSMKEESQPTKIIQLNENETVEWFEDGSFRYLGISGGSCSGGSGYLECKHKLVRYNSGGIDMFFVSDYGTYNGAYDKIHRAYDEDYSCFAGYGCSYVSFDGNASTETASRPAEASLKISTSSNLHTLKLSVGKNNARAIHY